MRSLTRTLVANLRKRQAGFTLVELLVVVGIIVALGAVIVPNVIQFASSGEEGARTAEAASVQSAIDTYMTEGGFPIVAPSPALGPALGDFSVAPLVLVATDGSSLLRNLDTAFDYCWDDTGLLTFPTQLDIDNGTLVPAAGCP